MNITIWLLMIINYIAVLFQDKFDIVDGIALIFIGLIILKVSEDVEKDIKKLLGKE